jgi:hypothetical protein
VAVQKLNIKGVFRLGTAGANSKGRKTLARSSKLTTCSSVVCTHLGSSDTEERPSGDEIPSPSQLWEIRNIIVPSSSFSEQIFYVSPEPSLSF